MSSNKFWFSPQCPVVDETGRCQNTVKLISGQFDFCGFHHVLALENDEAFRKRVEEWYCLCPNEAEIDESMKKAKEHRRATETALVHLWARYRNCDMSVVEEDVEKACETHKQAHCAFVMAQKEKTRIMWEAREKLAPGVHAQEQAAKATRNPMWKKFIAVTPTKVPEPYPLTADAEFTKCMSMWTCHCTKHTDAETMYP
jgi:hypothetical protein